MRNHKSMDLTREVDWVGFAFSKDHLDVRERMGRSEANRERSETRCSSLDSR